MTRPFVPRNALRTAALGLTCAAFSVGIAAAQQPPAAPEPQMPPMPSMEGQQGDVSKPITQIPPRKRAAAEKKSAPTARPAAGRKKATRKKR